jgi:hypothetical protein
MAYNSSTVHPALGWLWRAERFCNDGGYESSVEQAAATTQKLNIRRRRYKTQDEPKKNRFLGIGAG